MKGLQCERVRELLPEWVAEILDDEVEAPVRQHLSS